MNTPIPGNGNPNGRAFQGDNGPARAAAGHRARTAGTHPRASAPGLAPLMFAAGLTLAAEVQAVGETTRVSVDSAGEQGNRGSLQPTVSADGRFVAFVSDANKLVSDDTNRTTDVFVHDWLTRQTTRVSVASTGEQGNRTSYDDTALSADGRFVAYGSRATNLVPGDTNRSEDIFVHDWLSHQTTRVSVDSDGHQGNAGSSMGALSADGRFVAFYSSASNLVPGDTNDLSDVFVHDRKLHQTTRVSVDSAGNQGQGSSTTPALSADGRFVAFASSAATLAPGNDVGGQFIYVHDRQTHETTRITHYSTAGNAQSYQPSISADGRFVAFYSAYSFFPDDTNYLNDIFVHDRLTRQTSQVSVASDGSQGNGASFLPSLSADGRFVAYGSEATNLGPSDTNGVAIGGYLHDRLSRQTTRINGDAADRHGTTEPTLSADGRFVAFASFSSQNVAGDTNAAWDVFVRDRLIDRSATADLAVTQTVSPSPFPAESPITYTVTVTNHGPDAANDVTLADGPLKATAVASQGTCSAGAPKVCYLGTLVAGADATVTLTLRPRSPGTTRVWNSARVDAAPVDPNPGNNKTGLHVSAAP